MANLWHTKNYKCHNIVALHIIGFAIFEVKSWTGLIQSLMRYLIFDSDSGWTNTIETPRSSNTHQCRIQLPNRAHLMFQWFERVPTLSLSSCTIFRLHNFQSISSMPSYAYYFERTLSPYSQPIPHHSPIRHNSRDFLTWISFSSFFSSLFLQQSQTSSLIWPLHLTRGGDPWGWPARGDPFIWPS